MQLAVLVLAALILGAGILLGRRGVIRWLRLRAARPTHSLPPNATLEEAARVLPVVRRLPDADRQTLIAKAQTIVAATHWEGCAGLTLTDDMRAQIALQAALLVRALPGDPYPSLRSVLVYPSTFFPRRFSWTPSRDAAEADPTLGEAWTEGTVILSWDSARDGARDPDDGYNVVLHEFAHQLDMMSGAPDGVPVLSADDRPAWTATIDREYEQLVRDAERGADGVLDHYGATDRAEFFAVATEAFFERAHRLERERPRLYEALRQFYRQDPART